MQQIISFNSDSQLTALPPLSLYIHIPWCVQKCPYCDFNSHQAQNKFDEQQYIDALLTDLVSELPYVWGRSIETIFIGGGTPSLFSAEGIDTLLKGVRSLISVNPMAEITMEANPGTFERERFEGFKEAGINRLSIGVQSFNNTHLKQLGRIHNAQEAILAIESATNIFERVNIDLMYALPKQTIAEAVADVTQAIDLGVSHISAYQLTLEPNTAFHHRPPQGLPDDDLLQDIEDAVHHELFSAGFERYEVSAFTKNSHCQHNLNYWQFGDYIGIGAGAHGKISSHNQIVRTTRKRHPKDYLEHIQQDSSAQERIDIKKADLPFEFMLNSLRLLNGVESRLFTERTGLAMHTISQAVSQGIQSGLLNEHPAYLKATPLGHRFLNDLLQLFLQESKHG